MFRVHTMQMCRCLKERKIREFQIRLKNDFNPIVFNLVRPPPLSEPDNDRFRNKTDQLPKTQSIFDQLTKKQGKYLGHKTSSLYFRVKPRISLFNITYLLQFLWRPSFYFKLCQSEFIFNSNSSLNKSPKFFRSSQIKSPGNSI